IVRVAVAQRKRALAADVGISLVRRLQWHMRGLLDDQRIGNAFERLARFPVAEELLDLRADDRGVEVADDGDLRLFAAVERRVESLERCGIRRLEFRDLLVEGWHVAVVATRIRIVVSPECADRDGARLDPPRVELSDLLALERFELRGWERGLAQDFRDE